MTFLIEVMLTNAVTLTLLAGLAWLINLWVKRPGWLYLIWLSVLLRAVAPPLWELPIVPAVATPAPVGEPKIAGEQISLVTPNVSSDELAGEPLAEGLVAQGSGAERLAEPVSLPTDIKQWSVWDLLSAIWLAGSVLFLGLAVVRGRRFERYLALGSPAGEDVQRMGEEVAARLKTRCPQIWLVDGQVSPLLWHRPGRLWLVVPRLLWTALTDRERRLLLAHELAHVKRKDHWVRLLEMFTTACYWWHPILRWSRTRLRRAEEHCCDEEVLRHFPGSRSSYARSLCRAAGFLAEGRIQEPQFSCGAGTVELEGRIRDIMKKESSLSFPLWQKLALTVVCGWGLLLFPTRAAGINQSTSAEQQEYLSSLRSETEELQKQMRELRTRQYQLEAERMRVQQQAEIQRLDTEISRLESSGRADMAGWLRKQQELMASRLELRLQQLHLEGQSQLEMAEVQSRLAALQLEMEIAATGNRAERVAELESELAHLRSAETELELEWQDRQADLEQAALELEERDQRLQVERLRLEGSEEQADSMEAEIRLRREMRELELKQHRTQQRLHRLEVLQSEIHSTARRASELRSQGQVEEAEKLERRLQDLKKKLDSKP